MDEKSVRVLLRKMADNEVPPPRVSLEVAMAAGRRQRRRRQAGIGGSVIAASGVAGVVAVLLVLPTSDPSQQRSGAGPTPSAVTTTGPGQSLLSPGPHRAPSGAAR